MDDAVARFRAAADRENRGRRHVRRRYSKGLQAEAVRICRQQATHGVGLRDVAVALGVAPWSLHRWKQRASPTAGRFRQVAVAGSSSRPADRALVVLITPSALRVEGLAVEDAARLLRLLR